jgi:hypothetical protein
MSIDHLFRVPQPVVDAISDLAINREATAKRWGRAHGYAGREGGFIYAADGKRICQGWFAFFLKFRALILADVEAGTFKPSCERTKR